MGCVDRLAHGAPVQHEQESRAVLAQAHGDAADLVQHASFVGIASRLDAEVSGTIPGIVSSTGARAGRPKVMIAA